MLLFDVVGKCRFTRQLVSSVVLSKDNYELVNQITGMYSMPV